MIVNVDQNSFQIETNKIFILSGNIVLIEVFGEQTDTIADDHYRLHSILCEKYPGQIKYLIDLNSAGKSTSKARQIWKNLSEDRTTDSVALFGLHPVAKVLASFVTGRSQKSNTRFFSNKADALTWLENQPH